MALHEIEKGLDLPISGEPLQVVRETRLTSRVAVVADDFPGMKPAMRVAEGDTVKRGQVLFEDRKTAGVLHTAPGAGQVIGVHRGAKRAFQSLVIHLSDSEAAGTPSEDEQQRFGAYTAADPASLDREQIIALLVESGQWTALRTRPYSKVPMPPAPAGDGALPHSIFVTAVDTNPLAADPEVVVERRQADFERGLSLIAKLTDGKTYLCIGAGSDIGSRTQAPVQIEEFKGPHPSGCAGVHIHTLDPVGRAKTVWTIGYQDVIAIGHLFATGKLDVERVVSIAGPAVEEPQLVLTRLGAYVDELVPLPDDGVERRLIAGSVLSGKATSSEPFSYLGRYHHQVTVLREGRERVFLGWLTPGWDAFSALPIYLSRMMSSKKFPFTTTTNGSHRKMVPLGQYERVMPMDILPTHLLRAITVGDIEQAEKLGLLELDEEDVALCSFVCAGKSDYGPLLRKNLEILEKEG